jgi:hypothetical protein
MLSSLPKKKKKFLIENYVHLALKIEGRKGRKLLLYKKGK